MRLGIVVAMPAEARSLTKQRVVLGEQIQLQERISLCLSGVGPRRARRAAEALLMKGSTALLSWGTAGGLDEGLSPGSLVLPRSVIASDQTVYEVHADWHGRIVSLLSDKLNLHTEPLAESPGVLVSPAAKKALSHRTGAIAVDMESAAVGLVARAANVPFMALRAIADPVGMPLPKSALVAFNSSGQMRVLGVLKGLLRHPTDLLRLVYLGISFRTAQGTLTTVAQTVGIDALTP